MTLPDGRRAKISGTPAINTRKAAEDAERAHIGRLLNPAGAKVEAPLFDAFADEFMATYVAANNKPSEVNSKECILRVHLRPRFGKRRLDEIKRRDVESMKAALLKAGKSHGLRHTFCSHLAMRGAPARAIQELAGHASLMTTQRYMHLTPGAGRAAIDLLSDPLGQQVDNSARLVEKKRSNLES